MQKESRPGQGRREADALFQYAHTSKGCNYSAKKSLLPEQARKPGANTVHDTTGLRQVLQMAGGGKTFVKSNGPKPKKAKAVKNKNNVNYVLVIVASLLMVFVANVFSDLDLENLGSVVSKAGVERTCFYREMSCLPIDRAYFYRVIYPMYRTDL